jgi:hypothetical protein
MLPGVNGAPIGGCSGVPSRLVAALPPAPEAPPLDTLGVGIIPSNVGKAGPSPPSSALEHASAVPANSKNNHPFADDVLRMSPG